MRCDVNKDDLTEALLQGGRLETKAAAREVVDQMFGAMTTTLQKGGEVSIHGFGSFKVKQRAARTARNPHTGEAIKVPAKKAVGFKPASALKEAVNRKK
jgi:DNA-binding protein HU-beta